MKYNRIAEARKQHGKTQEEIANFLGIVRSQYARYETGARELPMHHFLTLAKYYNLSLDYLTGLTDTKRTLTE